MERKKKSVKKDKEKIKIRMKKGYRAPSLVNHGSLADLTAKITGGRDGSGTKSA